MKIEKEHFEKWFKLRGHDKEEIQTHWSAWDIVVNNIFSAGIKRQPEFFIQCAYESSYFKRVCENLNYSSPDRILKVFRSRVRTLSKAKKLIRNPVALAEAVYGKMLGNNSTKAKALYKKGWTVFNFRGTGYIQLTGFENWQDFKKQTGVDCFQDKDYFIDHPWEASGFYWVRHKLDYLPGIKEQTRAINGPACHGLGQRKKLFKELLKIMS